MIRRTSALVLASTTAMAVGQDIPLDFNWNALVQPSELVSIDTNQPNGFRSIGDRAFIYGFADSLGGTTGEVLGIYGTYQLPSTPNIPDLVFVGRRNANGADPVWDDVADGDDLGTQPAWDPTDGSGTLLLATTTFDAPIPMNSGSNVGIIFCATNGGADFDVTLEFTDGSSVTYFVTVPDWFANFDPTALPPGPGLEWQYVIPGTLSGGDGHFGTNSVDLAVPGEPLTALEAVATTSTLNSDLGFNMDGKMLESITFDATFFFKINPNSGLGIMGLTVNDNNVPLDANWNGIVQGDELNISNANSPDGYRSMGDRGLIVGETDSPGGTTGELVTDAHTYNLSLASSAVDTLVVGTRSRPFDDVADGDDLGVLPDWDVTGGTGMIPSWTTVLPSPITMSSDSSLGLIYNASEGGGNFNVTLEFSDSSTVTVELHAPDWYANNNPTANAPLPGVASQMVLAGPLSGGDGFSATQSVDLAIPGDPLNVTEAVITANSLMTDLGFDVNGKTLEFITFDSLFGGNQAVGIFAASHAEGGAPCLPDTNNDGELDFFDVQQFLIWFSSNDDRADFIDDDILDFADVLQFLGLFSAGC